MFIMFIIKDIGLVGTYYALNKIFEKYCNKKVARNLICITHASTSIIINILHMMSGNYLISLLDISKGYFLYDIYYMIRYDKKNIITYIYIYHHLATLCCLYRKIPCSSIMLLLAEISNLSTYIVYHNIKTNNNKKKIKLSKKIQKYTYGLFRVPLMTYFLYKNIVNNNVDKASLYIMTPVYFMGLYYTIYLFCNN